LRLRRSRRSSHPKINAMDLGGEVLVGGKTASDGNAVWIAEKKWDFYSGRLR
jgi:hypothetical protein